MSTLSISLPTALMSFVNEQATKRGYATSGEYVCDLIRADRGRVELRDRLLDGAASKATANVDDSYFDGLRSRVRHTG